AVNSDRPEKRMLRCEALGQDKNSGHRRKNSHTRSHEARAEWADEVVSGPRAIERVSDSRKHRRKGRSMKVELIYDADCPNVAETRANLLQAFAAVHLKAKWTGWERSSPSSPAYAAGFGSPTVLVEGCDVAGDSPKEHI